MQAMAAKIANPDPAVGRIISHMNADHQDSLIRYLEYNHGLSSFAARDAQLLDVSLRHLLISTNATKKPQKGTTQPALDVSYTIPLEPPMTKWSEARERFAQMDKACQQGLGRKDLTLKQYFLPEGVHMITHVVCAITFIILHRRANLSPSTSPAFLKPLLDRFPTATNFLWTLQPMVFYPMIAIHLTEAAHMHFSRLRSYNVPTGSTLWAKWMLSTFVGGFGNFIQIDAWAAEEKARKEKMKH